MHRLEPETRHRRSRAVVGGALALLCGACSLVDDPTPSDVFFLMNGPSGTEIQLVLSTEFVAGVNEFRVTEVQLFRSDTILTVLPVDTVVSIAVAQRFFVEVLPVQPDTLEVQVRVDVDTRRLYDRTGHVWQEVPFRYVYLFNQAVTQIVDVVL